jgi:2-methylcitrate dehydratase PrpD
VHRLWEPLAHKQKPPNGYAAKFSTPYCLAAGFVHGGVGLDAFTDQAVRDPAVLALAAKVRYAIDPANPYPHNYTGHIRAVLRDGTVVEERQPHLRGGAHEPLLRADLEDKFARNARHGGWSEAEIAAGLALARNFSDGPIDLQALRR